MKRGGDPVSSSRKIIQQESEPAEEDTEKVEQN